MSGNDGCGIKDEHNENVTVMIVNFNLHKGWLRRHLHKSKENGGMYHMVNLRALLTGLTGN